MAKHDWEALQAAFLADNADTGITAQQWCEQHGLNYQSARRYIKPRAAQSAQKKPRRTAHNAQSDATAQTVMTQKRKNKNYHRTQTMTAIPSQSQPRNRTPADLATGNSPKVTVIQKVMQVIPIRLALLLPAIRQPESMALMRGI